MKASAVLFWLICGANLLVSGQQGNSPHTSPYSWVTTSENGVYDFVLLSSHQIDEYEKLTLKSWREAGFSKAEISKMRDGLRNELNSEKDIRQKYKISGLFKKSDLRSPLFEVKNFPADIDAILVADDGSFVIGINQFVTISRIDSNAIASELIKTPQDAIIVLLSNGKSCSHKLIDILTERDRLAVTSEGYYWTEGKPTLNNEINVMELKKLDNEVLSLDLNKCKTSYETSTSGPPAPNRCIGLALILGFYVHFLSRPVDRNQK